MTWLSASKSTASGRAPVDWANTGLKQGALAMTSLSGAMITPSAPAAAMAMRLPSGETIASTGRDASGIGGLVVTAPVAGFTMVTAPCRIPVLHPGTDEVSP